MVKTKVAKKTKPEKFFGGQPIKYSKSINRLKIDLTLIADKKSEWKRGVNWTYSASLEVSWTDGGICETRVRVDYQPYWFKDNGSFGGLFDNLFDYSENIVTMLQTEDDGPTESNFIRGIHSIEDLVKSDFLNPRDGWTNLREDLLEKYFKKESPYPKDD